MPDKRIYHIKGRPTTLSNINYAVIIKEVPAELNPAPLTLEEVLQLCTIIHETEYVSMTSTNYIRMPNGNISLIDTEATFDRNKLIKGFLRMIGTRHNLNTNYTEKALKHIFWEVKQILEQKHTSSKATIKEIRRYLQDQERPLAWSYDTYFEELFSV